MASWQTEEQLIRFLNKIDDEVRAGRGNLDRRVSDNIEQYRGNQWKGNKAPYFMYNVIEACLEEKHGKLSESKPDIDVLPTREDLGSAAEVLTNATKSIWTRAGMEHNKTERLALWGSLAGASFLGTVWNPRRKEIELIIKDPRACGIDISVVAGEDADLGEYATFEDFVSLDIIRDQYPGRGALVKPDERISGFDTQPEKSAAQKIRSAYTRIWQKRQPEKVSAIPKAIVREYYIQDRRKNINDAGVVPAVDGLTRYAKDGIPFPGGRRIIRAGDEILDDGFNPYWDGAYPIDMMSWKLDPETAWGADEIQSVKRMQEAINRLGDAYTKTAIINAVVRVIMDAGALSPEEKNRLSNEVGQIIEKNPGREFTYQTPPLLPVDVINFVSTLMVWVRQKLGVQQPPTQNRVPSIITGPAIEGLQLMIETPIRTAARRVEEFYARVGQKLISRIFQYYTSDRIIPLVGADNKWVKFEFKRMDILRDKRGNKRSEEDMRKAFQDFYFTIAPGSSLAITKTQRAMTKFQLASAGWVHPREVLMELGIQNPDEKLKQAAEAKEAGLLDVVMGGRSGSSGLSSILSGNDQLAA